MNKVDDARNEFHRIAEKIGREIMRRDPIVHGCVTMIGIGQLPTEDALVHAIRCLADPNRTYLEALTKAATHAPPAPIVIEGAEFLPPPPTRVVSCRTCGDTRRMTIGEDTPRKVPCTFCPRPCQECRTGGVGAYCATVPCLCGCHS